MSNPNKSDLNPDPDPRQKSDLNPVPRAKKSDRDRDFRSRDRRSVNTCYYPFKIMTKFIYFSKVVGKVSYTMLERVIACST